MKKTIRDLELKGRKVIMRVDFNVPIEAGKIDDDTRIRSSLPTIEYALAHGAAVILMSHLGRPKGFDKSQSLAPCAVRLGELLHRPVQMAPDCMGPEVQKLAAALKPGEVLMLENTRFHAEEEGKAKTEGLPDDEAKKKKAEMKAKQKEMAKQLAALADVFVNDAFGSAHRAHASTSIIVEFIKEAALGFLMEKEVECLGKVLSPTAQRPRVAIIGGAKISDKLEVIQTFIKQMDVILIGGGMAYTFLLAQGRKIGKSINEKDLIGAADKIMKDAKAAGVELLLPVDNVIADAFAETAKTRIASGDFPEGWQGVDIGPQTIELFCRKIKAAKTIVWNGPMGVFEMAPFANGTYAVAKAVAASGAFSVIGGGDSVSAVNKSGLADQMSHISTGGGASLEFLSGLALPGVAVIKDK